VRQLEASLSQVNEEHCELVKQVVMAKLEREELEDELVKCESSLVSTSALEHRCPAETDLLFLPLSYPRAHTDKIAYA
jgi:hypothetical protein